jgi:hypothetical protein
MLSREQVNFHWDDDDVCFVLDQHAELDLHSASSLKQQSVEVVNKAGLIVFHCPVNCCHNLRQINEIHCFNYINSMQWKVCRREFRYSIFSIINKKIKYQFYSLWFDPRWCGFSVMGERNNLLKNENKYCHLKIFITTDCCFSELALCKSNSACWSRTKQTSSSSQWKLTCSRDNIA